MTKSKLKCRTEAKAQVNYRKPQRTRMNQQERRRGKKEIEQLTVPIETARFERFRWDRAGKRIGHEVLTVSFPAVANESLEELEARSYEVLFAKYPNWGNGQPVIDGIGWSSALIANKS